MQGFNYGPALSGPQPPIYQTAMKLAHALAEKALATASDAWALEMAIRNVRLACTGVEKAMAVTQLAKEMSRVGGTNGN
jgi:hypothetical protein